MRIYGLTKPQLDEVKIALSKTFLDADNTKVFLFGSRAAGTQKPFSDVDLVIDSSEENTSAKLSRLSDLLEESDLPYKFDIVKLDDVIPEYRKNINRQKILFWTPAEPAAQIKWRICPIGQHWVKRHPRELKSGTVVDRDGHCRKNRSRKEILTGDEMDGIREFPAFKEPKVLVSTNDLGSPLGNKYNDLISGWTAYWNDMFEGQVAKPLHSNFVKALILSESSFKPIAFNESEKKRIGKARGLVQLTDQTRRILRDPKGELRDFLITLSAKDALDPNKNIAEAIRWLFRKYETAKARLERIPSWEEVLWEYKGITMQHGTDTDKIRNSLGRVPNLTNHSIHFPILIQINKQAA